MAENAASPNWGGGLDILATAPQAAAAWTRGRWATWGSFLGTVCLAFALYTWGLSQSGYGNTYYAAAVRSMTLSWSNFFFGAFDPGGFITVDKPPAFLWAGALSARVFGYSTWAILMPSAVAGAASVGLLWLIVRKWFGLTAATIAGLALALSPISVAVNRLNLPEPFLVLALIGAAGSVLQSLESRRPLAWIALAGFLAGVAFNTKMLAAWIPGPALALALAVAMPVVSRKNLRHLTGRLAVLLVVTLAVSASWMVIVDSWPASARPYIGGSTDNTVLDLALGYNGFGRVDGEDQGGGRGGGPAQPPAGGGAGTQGQLPGGRIAPPNADGRAGDGGGATLGNGVRAAGGIIAGVPGLFRMFDSANGGQIGWLLPFALGGGALALWSWRRDPQRRAFAALFVGWVLLYGGVFSYAQGIYHSYYTAALAPGVAALTGAGTAAAVREVRRNPAWLAAPVALAAATVLVQLEIAGRTPGFYGWVRPLTVLVASAGIVLAAALATRRLPVSAGMAVAVAGMLLLPGAWSVSEAANASLNTTLPQAGPREGASGQSFGSEAFDDGTDELAAWLESHGDANAKWQLVASSAQSASRLVTEYGVSVMALGGFSGRDDAITVDEFAGFVDAGDVRYVSVRQGMGPGGGQPPAGGPLQDGGRFRGAPGIADGFAGDGGRAPAGVAQPPGGRGAANSGIMSVVETVCAPVTDPGLPAEYQDVIYDCSGMADAIREAG